MYSIKIIFSGFNFHTMKLHLLFHFEVIVCYLIANSTQKGKAKIKMSLIRYQSKLVIFRLTTEIEIKMVSFDN